MNTPKIRFKGFTDDWEQRKFGEITELKSASRVHKDEWTSNGVPFYRSSDVMAAINETENEKAFISEELYEKLSKVSGKLEEGDILVTGGGSVGNPYIVPDNKPLYTKDADLLWIKNKGKFHPYFLYEFFFSPTFRNYLGSISHVGTIAHYTITQLSDTPICLPSFEEQKKVGEYFQSLDNLITLHQRKCDETKQLKKFMLQKMFPKNGEKNPKIRFEGFTDDWEQRKLGALMEDGIILEQSDGNHGELYPRSEEFVNEGIPYIAASSISSDGERIDFNLTKYLSMERAIQFRKGVAKNGDVLLAHNATVGPSVMLSMDYEFAILSTSLTLYRLDKEKMSPMFFLQAIRSGYFQKQLEVFMKQTTRSQVPILTQRNLQISYPINKVEQERIGEFLSNLDHLITLHQRKCEKLKALKKFMLQNMFI